MPPSTYIKHGIVMDAELDIPVDQRDLPDYQFREWVAGMRTIERTRPGIQFIYEGVGLVRMTWVEFDAVVSQGREALARYVHGIGLRN